MKRNYAWRLLLADFWEELVLLWIGSSCLELSLECAEDDILHGFSVSTILTFWAK